MKKEVLTKSKEIWLKTQKVKVPETIISKEDFLKLKDNWIDEELPELQEKVVNVEMEAIADGDYVFPIYSSYINILKSINLDSFTLLDAACGTGHYYEAMKRLLKGKKVKYCGSDYSKYMIQLAQSKYPDAEFFVQDLCNLPFEYKVYDVVMLSGVIEHVSDWELVLRNSSKLANKYLIIHRGQFSLDNTVYTKGGQYNIVTPKAYISKDQVLNTLKSLNLDLVGEFEHGVGKRVVTHSIQGNTLKIDRVSMLLKTSGLE